jgi:hypothetical protein
LTLNTNATNPSLQVPLSGTGISSTGNLAAGAPATAQSYIQTYVPGNVSDTSATTYWESANNAFPQWVQVDLGSAMTVGRVVLKLPPTWGARTQTLSVQGSTTGTSFSTLSASAGRLFDPASQNVATISFTPSSQRYVRILITANTGWPAGQLSALEVYSS